MNNPGAVSVAYWRHYIDLHKAKHGGAARWMSVTSTDLEDLVASLEQSHTQIEALRAETQRLTSIARLNDRT